MGQVAVVGFTINKFSTANSPEFFVLLFLPFVVAPIVALATRRIAAKPIGALVGYMREFRPIDYLVISGALYAYVIAALLRADAFDLMRRGSDVFEAVRSRYELLDRLGYWPQACLKSLLLFLACYAFVRALRHRERFWIIAATVTFFMMTVLLVLLNMKWPVLIYYVALTLAAFCFSRRRPFLHGIACLLITVGCYAMISSTLLRLAPTLAVKSTSEFSRHEPSGATASAERIGSAFSFLGNSAAAAASSYAFLGFTLVNRMAQPYPYYVEAFQKGNNVCGTLLDRIERKQNPCQPSNLIYNRMFGDDQFGAIVAGRGTAPQAVHVYGYALQGWTGAMIELVLASIVIGLFISLPISGPLSATIAIMGALTGYFFSQLPFEGPLIYDHGILWWGCLIVAYSAIYFIIASTAGRR